MPLFKAEDLKNKYKKHMDEFIHMYLGPNVLVTFHGDPKEYTIKSVNQDKEHIFITLNGAQTYSKEIRRINSINRKPISFDNFKKEDPDYKRYSFYVDLILDKVNHGEDFATVMSSLSKGNKQFTSQDWNKIELLVNQRYLNQGLEERKQGKIEESYSRAQKSLIVEKVNKILLAISNLPNKAEVEKDLNKILEFYRYYSSNFQIEDKIVFDEFNGKLDSVLEKYNISL